MNISWKEQMKMKRASFASMVYENKKKKTRREKFLEEMDRVIPWEELLQVISPHYPKAGNGRQPMPLSRMLRIYFMQQWYGLSDPAMEDSLWADIVAAAGEPMISATGGTPNVHVVAHSRPGDAPIVVMATNDFVWSDGFNRDTGACIAIGNFVDDQIDDVTDLSISYKLAANSLLVWVTSIHTGEPVAGAHLILVDGCDSYLYFPGKTDEQGILFIKDGLKLPATLIGKETKGLSKRAIKVSDLARVVAATPTD